MMLGMAIRMATDLNLHRKSMASGLDTEEGRARDLEVRLSNPAIMVIPYSAKYPIGHLSVLGLIERL
jgi:hypothetical protein